MKRGSRVRHVRVTAGFGEHLHFAVHAASISSGAICQRKVAVHEDVSGRAVSLYIGQTVVLACENVAKSNEFPASGFGRLRRRYPVVEMNLDLAPAFVTQICQALQQVLVVLFCRRKIGVRKALAVVVSEGSEVSRILLAPSVQSYFLNLTGRVSSIISRQAAGLKMVGQGNHQVDWAARRPARQSLPGITGKTSAGILRPARELAAAPGFNHL